MCGTKLSGLWPFLERNWTALLYDKGVQANSNYFFKSKGVQSCSWRTTILQSLVLALIKYTWTSPVGEYQSWTLQAGVPPGAGWDIFALGERIGIKEISFVISLSYDNPVRSIGDSPIVFYHFYLSAQSLSSRERTDTLNVDLKRNAISPLSVLELATSLGSPVRSQ